MIECIVNDYILQSVYNSNYGDLGFLNNINSKIAFVVSIITVYWDLSLIQSGGIPI